MRFYLKLKAYFEFLKPRLSLLVAFSAAFGYILAVKGCNWEWKTLIILCIGGLFVSGFSVGLNQIMEKRYDELMIRTINRPLPMKKISFLESFFFIFIIGIFGIILLFFYTNFLTVLLSLISVFLYNFIYTPLKRLNSLSVVIGAFPGALPPLIGWTAATNSISYEGLIIFMIQFIWQFPHFWSIAWVINDDYNLAGFRLLPKDGKKNFSTVFQIMIYIFFLIPLTLLPAKFGITGFNSSIVVILCGIFFLNQVYYLLKNCSKKVALKVMFGSFFYLPIIQIFFLLDRI